MGSLRKTFSRLTVLVALTGGVCPPAAAAPDAERIEAWHVERALAQQRAERWKRVLDTRQRLSRDPGAFASHAETAAADLSRSGKELVLEGTTLGLTSYFKLQAFYARESPRAEQNFRQAAALINGVWKGYAKEQALGPGTKPWKPEDEVARANALLQMGVDVLPADKPTRALLQATLDLGRSGTLWLGAYASGDRLKTEEHLQAIQALLQGTRGMLYAWGVTTKKQDWVSQSMVLSRRYPMFGKVAERMTTVGLAEFNVALAIANLGFGSYAWLQGRELENYALAIRADQSRALATLDRLLPKAKAELAEARRQVRRLDALLEAASGPPSRVTAPSRRFMDDGVGIPSPPTSLPRVTAVVGRVPPLNFELTAEARERREREAEARRKAERAAARAAAAAQRDYAESRDYGYSSDSGSSSSSSTDSGSSSVGSSSSHIGNVGSKMNGIIDELNKQQRGSGLGAIKGLD